MSSLTGRSFGHYQIFERVGRGGMATVYRALDRNNRQEVAIKIISPPLAENEQFLRRFRREVKVVARLNHPNIVPVLDYGEQEGYAYQVMPFLKVGSLTERLESGPLSLAEGIRLLDQVASALAHAHRHGVVHRDVKPSNMLLDQDGKAMLADFGMARRVEASESLTGSAVIGTPAYMAPEQVQGGPVDARSDQYALGVVLFQLATGTLPYDAETPMGYLLKHVNEPFPAARMRNPQVPETIEKVILKATAKEPGQRFASVSEMNRTLYAAVAYLRDPIANQAPTIALPSPSGSALLAGAPRRSRRNLRISAAVAAALLIVLAVPVFAADMVGLLELFSNPAEGSLLGPAALQLTAQAGTIEALSTELAGSGSMSANEIETAVALTLTAASLPNPGVAEGATFTRGFNPVGEEFSSIGTASSNTPTPGATSGGSPVPSRTPTQRNSPAASRTPTQRSVPVSPTATQVASSSTPSPSPEASPTPPPTGTATPTSTSVPTQTQAPTSLPTPTATQEPCSLITLDEFDVEYQQVSWTLTNESSAMITVERIALDWPFGNGALGRIRLGGSSIWNGNDEEPPSDVSSGLTGNRRLLSGRSKELTFEFTAAAQPSGYDVVVHLDSGCQPSSDS